MTGEEREGLPPGWATERIGNLCDLQNGRAFKPSEWAETGLPIVRIQNLNKSDSRYNYFEGQYDQRNYLSGGELLFAWSGTPGTSFGAHIWKGGEALLNQHIFRVDFDENYLDKRYFRHAINQQLKNLIDIAHGGVGLRHVTKGKFEATELPLPPLAEQVRIADKLDALLARVEAGRERLERVPKLLKRFRQSVLSAAVSGELTREWRESQTFTDVISRENIEEERKKIWNSKNLQQRKSIYKSPLRANSEGNNDLPECWKIYSVDELTEFVTDGEHATPKRTEKGVLLLSARNVMNGFLRLDNVDFISEETYADLSRRVLPQGGDVLLSCSGTVGRSCVAPDGLRFSLVRSVAIMRPIFGLGSWLSYVFQSPQLQALMSDRKTETAQANLFQGKIKVLPIPFPPLSEQSEIIRRIEALLAIADRIEAKYAAALSSFDRLTPALLAKAFRGELVPQDPNDEPASVLLERIRAAREAEGGQRGRGRPAKAAAGSGDGAEVKRRGRPPKVREAVSEPAGQPAAVPEAVEASAAPRGRGRPPGPGIPQASSFEDALRKLEEQKLTRAQGARQVGLFDDA